MAKKPKIGGLLDDLAERTIKKSTAPAPYIEKDSVLHSYVDPSTGGYMNVVTRPTGPRGASVIDLYVPEEFRGQGVGKYLQSKVLEDFPSLQGQVSSKAAAKNAYDAGRRMAGNESASLDDIYKMIDENSSVNMWTKYGLLPGGLLGAGYAAAPSDAEAAPKVPRPRLHGPSLTDAVESALPSQPSQLSQARPDWIGENGAITANPPWLRPDPNERSTIGKLYDAVTTNPVGTFKAAGSALGDAVKGYLGEVRQDPGKGVADALELGATAMGGAAPQAFWMATSPDTANAGEDAILAQRRKMMQGLLAD